MTIPLIVLAILSVIGGYVGIPRSLGGSNIFGQFLSEVFVKKEGAETVSQYPLTLEHLLMGASIVIVLIGIFLAFSFYIKNPQLPKRLSEKYRAIYKILSNKYYVDEIYSAVFVRPLLKLSTFLWQVFDVRIIDGTANGSAFLIKWFSGITRKLQTGYFRNYALSLFLGVIVILGYLILKLR
jgi:NADH-quinone oxidoreductase subunit L